MVYLLILIILDILNMIYFAHTVLIGNKYKEFLSFIFLLTILCLTFILGKVD